MYRISAMLPELSIIILKWKHELNIHINSKQYRYRDLHIFNHFLKAGSNKYLVQTRASQFEFNAPPDTVGLLFWRRS